MYWAKPKADAPSGATGEETEGAPEERRALFCRVCGTQITDFGALFCMRASTVFQVFPNPYGEMRKILTASHATSVVATADATTDFTWFAGYAWRIAYCASCSAHLGWLFESTDGSTPPSFYGFLESALNEGSYNV